jgi:hypothetical protein
MRVLRRSTALAVAVLLATMGLRAQPADSLRADSLAFAVPAAADSAALPSPRGALLRSLALPGWGQAYVGQPAKTPVVAGAFVGAVGLAVYLDGRYRRYRRAYLYVSREDADPTVPDAGNEFALFFDDWLATGARAAATTRQLRDDTRRNRDLALLGSAAVYALQALDAYVAAHLAGFDVSEDLAVRVVPTPDGPAALVVVRW